jgi:hypothetical protein
MKFNSFVCPSRARHAMVVLACAAVLSSFSQCASASFVWTKIALAHEPAPGLPTAVDFASFNPPTIDADGRVAFGAALFDPINRGGVWTTGPQGNALSVVAYDKQIAAQTTDAAYKVPRVKLRSSNSGNLGMWLDLGAVNGGQRIGSALYAGNAQGLQPVMRSGAPAPGVAGGTFADSEPSDVFRVEGNFAAFLANANVNGVPSVTGIWRAAIGSSPQPIFLSGTPSPDGSGPVEFITDRHDQHRASRIHNIKRKWPSLALV